MIEVFSLGSKRRWAAGALLVVAVTGLAGCGTAVPELAETGRQVDSEALVHAIVQSVHCELRNAVNYVRDKDTELSKFNNGIRTARWLDAWGVQVGLTLTVEEKTSLSPNSVWLPVSPPTAIFTLASGISGSAGATRINKLNYYYTVNELYDRGSCTAEELPERRESLLIQSDLKLKEWLITAVLEVGTGQVGVPTSPSSYLKQNVMSHEVKFEVLTGASVTPAWKLVRATVNQSGSFFSTSRVRTHDLLIVLGPTDPKTGDLSSAASASYLASQIGLSIARSSALP